MKKNKIIGIAVATLGIIISMGGAIALYTKAAQDTNFGISAGSYTGSTSTVTYKINNSASPTLTPSYINSDESQTGTGLSAEFSQIKYVCSLGAEYANDVIQQDLVLGNLEVELKNVPAAYQGKLAVYTRIDNYIADVIGDNDTHKGVSYGKQQYEHVLGASDYNITSEAQTFKSSADIAVKADGTQQLVIYLKFNFGEGGLDTLNLNEANLGYSLTVKWTAVSESYKKAYVVGNGNMWEDDDEYMMIPNIDKANSEGFEWMFNRLPGTMAEAKCHGGEYNAWSDGGNAQLNQANSYDVYWAGSASDSAYFSARS